MKFMSLIPTNSSTLLLLLHELSASLVPFMILDVVLQVFCFVMIITQLLTLNKRTTKNKTKTSETEGNPPPRAWMDSQPTDGKE